MLPSHLESIFMSVVRSLGLLLARPIVVGILSCKLLVLLFGFQ